MAGFRTPEQERAESGRGVTGRLRAQPLADVNPFNAHLFRENRWHDYFARLRREDPIHLNEIETAGRYWSVVTSTTTSRR